VAADQPRVNHAVEEEIVAGQQRRLGYIDRQKIRPLEYLGDYQGYVHADAYGGYDQLLARTAWSKSAAGVMRAVGSTKLWPHDRVKPAKSWR
jgi:hypothetical protein